MGAVLDQGEVVVVREEEEEAVVLELLAEVMEVEHDVDEDYVRDEDMANAADDAQERHSGSARLEQAHGWIGPFRARFHSKRFGKLGIGHDHDYQGSRGMARWSQKAVVVLRNTIFISITKTVL